MNNWTKELKSNLDNYLKALEIVEKNESKVFDLMIKAASVYDSEENEKSNNGKIYLKKEKIRNNYCDIQDEEEKLVTAIEELQNKIENCKDELDKTIKEKTRLERIIQANRFKFWNSTSWEKSSLSKCINAIATLNSEIKDLENQKMMLEFDVNDINDKKSQLENELEEINNIIKTIPSPDTYLNFLDSEEQNLIKCYFKALLSISCECMDEIDNELNIIDTTLYQFKNLIDLISITTNNYFNCEDINLGNKFSIVSQELFKEIQNDIKSEETEKTKTEFMSIKLPYTVIRDTDERKYSVLRFILAYGEKINFTSEYYLIRRDFINKLMGIIEENPEINLPDFALLLAKKAKANQVIVKKLIRFKELYEETPEQILITEQRYYQQKRLEQQEEQHAGLLEQLEETARLERVRQDRQAELDRQQQNRLSREQANREERRFKEQEQRQRDEEKRRRYEEKKNASERCFMCARYSKCSTRGTVGCAAYIPK